MFACTKIKPIWDYLKQMIKDKGRVLTWTMQSIMENKVHLKNTHVINFITLAVKQFIFQQKCLKNGVDIQTTCNQIRFYYKMECFNVNNKEEITERWRPVKEIIQEL